MEAVAKLRNNPTSTRKMRLLADLIRGLDADKALNILKFHPKHPSVPLEKLLLSAIANWRVKNEGERVEDANLFVKTIFVDGGRTLKRMRPAPQGRGYRIRKRSNHVTIIVDGRNPKVLPGAAVKEQELTMIPPVVEATLPPVEAAVKPAKKATTKKASSKKSDQ
ncbi:MAG: 50S ribosomal protein L22 [Chitinophagaceae bacterium]